MCYSANEGVDREQKYPPAGTGCLHQSKNLFKSNLLPFTVPCVFLLQQLREKNSNMCEELKCLQAQADSQLREERSRRCTLLQEEVQGALSTQQLLLKLQQAEDKVRVRP